ncbi:diguanylate cyclase [Rheinheimera sediminis]|uniref:GGDEF domain-containing protein n=1 Tax=Rheinheimera sp. YQF-1 TaxID=2499626 RepID=UPI000FDB1D0C|nr:GGDEF domain-containing protein [Rheinheimera sp. YQF-1]RVT48183.1 diguanylate cyclase [Rheinheimera sp. YQF-1]
MKFRTQFNLLVFIASLATMTVAGLSVHNEWQMYQQSVTAVKALQNVSVALIAAEMASKERGPTNALISQASETDVAIRTKVTEARIQTDAMLAALSTLSDALPLSADHNNFSCLATSHTQLMHARLAADTMAGTAPSQRSKAQIQQIIAEMAATVACAQHIALLEAKKAHTALPELTHRVQGALFVFELREKAGLLGSLLTPAFASGRPMSEQDLTDIQMMLGRVTQMQDLLKARLSSWQEPDSDDALTLWAQVESTYFLQALAIVQQVITASTNSSPYPMNASEFASRYVPKMQSMLKLRDVLLQNSQRAAQQRLAQARWDFMLHVVFVILLLTTLSAVVFLLHYRLLSPLQSSVKALQGVAEGKLDLPLPQVHKDDEMAAVVEAVELIKQHEQERSRLEAEREALIEQLQNLSNTDFLTGLFNRRAFLNTAVPVLSRSARYKAPFSLIALDIDHFKTINDTYGHDSGDRALIAVAAILRKAVRAHDLVARVGGEEFVILLESCNKQHALDFAERLRQEVKKTGIELLDGQTLYLTASFGVAESQDEQAELNDLLRRADSAMYKAKQAGRDRVAAD